MKKNVIFMIAILFLSACAHKSNNFARVDQISKASQCSSCTSPDGFEARIKGLLYISDIGIKCCANKRTLDTGVALKKVYLHSFYDLKENQKVFDAKGQKLFVNLDFNTIFYIYLKEELKTRGIVVLEDNKANSPYVTKVNLSFVDYSARQDHLGLRSRLVGVLSLSDINTNKKLTLRTRQDVKGFEDLKDIGFYTHLLVKQMANKVASIISEL